MKSKMLQMFHCTIYLAGDFEMEDWTQNPVDLYPNIYSHQHLIEQAGLKSQVKFIWDKCGPTRWADNR